MGEPGGSLLPERSFFWGEYTVPLRVFKDMVMAHSTKLRLAAYRQTLASSLPGVRGTAPQP